MQLLVVNLFLFFIFLVFNVYVFDVSLNVSPASSSSISLSGPRKRPSASRITYTNVSYIYVPLDLIRIISILFLWAIYLLSGIICIKVRFINFKSNISVLPKPHATQFLSSQNFQSWLYLYTFLLLLEPILLLFVLDKSITLFFPHIKSLVTLNKCFYSKIHRSCFLTFKYLIRLILFSASLFLSIPFAALWYLQLVIIK